MDAWNVDDWVTILTGVAIAVGLVGVVVPVLPGLLLCWAAVLVWAVLADAGSGRWLVLAAATVFAAGGTAVKYLWPGRNLVRSGVPTSSLLVGAALGVVGFFVLPVVGLPIGFVAGVWLGEWVRLRDRGEAWPSAWGAVKAVGLSIAVELAAGLAIAASWLAGVVLLT